MKNSITLYKDNEVLTFPISTIEHFWQLKEAMVFGMGLCKKHNVPEFSISLSLADGSTTSSVYSKDGDFLRTIYE